MNNFLDLLATDQSLQLHLKLVPVGQPNIQVCVDHTVIFQGVLTKTKILDLTAPLLIAFDITVQLKDKIYSSAQETAVIVEEFSIDHLQIIPDHTQLATYDNDHNYCDPTNYLGFNGTWRLQIPCAFYQWLHKITGQGWLLAPR